jgi:hypothetical protein
MYFPLMHGHGYMLISIACMILHVACLRLDRFAYDLPPAQVVRLWLGRLADGSLLARMACLRLDDGSLAAPTARSQSKSMSRYTRHKPDPVRAPKLGASSCGRVNRARAEVILSPILQVFGGVKVRS